MKLMQPEKRQASNSFIIKQNTPTFNKDIISSHPKYITAVCIFLIYVDVLSLTPKYLNNKKRDIRSIISFLL